MSSRATSFTAVLVGVVVAIGGVVLVLLSLSIVVGLSIGRSSEFAAAWERYGRQALLCDLVTTLVSAAVGGFVTSRRAVTARVAHSLSVGMVLLGCFLLAAFDPNDPVWYTTAVVLLVVPAAGLGGYVGATRTARAPDPGLPARGVWSRGIGAAGAICEWTAGLIAVGIALHLLVDRMGIGFTVWDAAALAGVAGLAGVLLRAAIAAPRRRAVRWVLIALATLVIPIGGLVLLVRLFLGFATVTVSAAAPDGRMVVQLVEPGRRFLDRNFTVRVRRAHGWWRHVWTSPDEGPPGRERFVWSRDGRHVLLIGSNSRALARFVRTPRRRWARGSRWRTSPRSSSPRCWALPAGPSSGLAVAPHAARRRKGRAEV